MATGPLTVERLAGGAGKGILCLQGPLTIENVTLFQSALRREEHADTIILDLSEVPYIDSSGLGSLVSAYISHHKAGRRVALSGVNERVFKLFRIMKVDSLFPIFPTLDDAVAAFSNPATA